MCTCYLYQIDATTDSSESAFEVHTDRFLLQKGVKANAEGGIIINYKSFIVVKVLQRFSFSIYSDTLL
jgi:hypothetical protein